MAINVNTVYTTVLSILNKEQRGYLTPYEFNQIATQVQLEVFEGFFEDYNQYIRGPKTNVEFASRMDHIMEEFQIFEKSGPSENGGAAQTNNVYPQPIDLHRFGSATFNKGVNSPPIEILSNRDYNQIKLSPLTQPTNNFPVAKYQQDKLTVFPSAAPYASSDVTFNYIRKPLDVRWGYIPNATLGNYVYDDTVYVSPIGAVPYPPVPPTASIPATAGSTQFEISESQQTEVILSILKYAGVVIRDPQIIQAASSELAQNEANTKR
tara:strand:- start:1324 stop:2121 length:798 start_codon:yes stop_codon:yes gene_type:complete